MCSNPDLAGERRRKRNALLAATEKNLVRVQAAVQRQRKSLHGENAIVLHRYRIIYVGQVERSLRGQRGSLETAAAVRLERERPIFAESTPLGLLKTRA